MLSEDINGKEIYMTSNSTVKKEYNGPKPDFCTLTGLAMYARVFEPAPYNEAFDSPPRWELDLLLTKKMAEEARAKGLAVRNDNPRYVSFCEANGYNEKGYSGEFIKVKKSTVRKVWDSKTNTVKKDSTGKPVMEPAQRPRVVDSRGTEIPDTAMLAIGNGSEVKVTFTLTKPTIGGKPQFGRFGARLFETCILELVEYKKPEGSFTFNGGNDSVNDEKFDAMLEDGIDFLPDED
jgi:hypothetical protein